MHIEAGTLKQYHDGLTKLERFPLIGTHTLGELTISASMKSWAVADGHGNAFGSAARSGAAIRTGIRTAVEKWLAGKFQGNG